MQGDSSHDAADLAGGAADGDRRGGHEAGEECVGRRVEGHGRQRRQAGGQQRDDQVETGSVFAYGLIIELRLQI